MKTVEFVEKFVRLSPGLRMTRSFPPEPVIEFFVEEALRQRLLY